MSLLAIAEAGIFLLENHGGWRSELLRAGPSLQCAVCDSADSSTIYTGSRGGGVQKSKDGGRNWHDLRLPLKEVFSLAVSPADGSLYAGTEPSRLFKSSDQGESWRELTALTEIPSAPTWSFPPRPWTSHVRAIAPNPRNPGLLLAGIELGGLMRSEDGGRPGPTTPPAHSGMSMRWPGIPALRNALMKRAEAARHGAKTGAGRGNRRTGAGRGNRRTRAATATIRGHWRWTRKIPTCGISPPARAHGTRMAAEMRRPTSTDGVARGHGKKWGTVFHSRSTLCHTP